MFDALLVPAYGTPPIMTWSSLPSGGYLALEQGNTSQNVCTVPENTVRGRYIFHSSRY
jgi:hypothetical protein